MDKLRGFRTRDRFEKPASFQYNKLDETLPLIRLLTLHTWDYGIECSISTVDLRQCPKYEALSYCWGPQTEKRLISIDGYSFEVSHNLFAALDMLKRPESLGEAHSEIKQPALRRLWIDAICINQQDLDERSLQVQLMWPIYSRASRVLVWLGETKDNSAIGMEMVRLLALRHEISMRDQIAELLEKQRISKEQVDTIPAPSPVEKHNVVPTSSDRSEEDNGNSLNVFWIGGNYTIGTEPVQPPSGEPSNLNNDPTSGTRPIEVTDEKEQSMIPFYMLWSVASKTNAPDPDAWVAFRRLLERPWWHRVWVIQEVAAAHDSVLVGCGSSWLEWDKFLYAQQCIDGAKNLPGLSRLHRLGEGTGAILDKFVLSTRKDGRLDSWSGFLNLLDSSSAYHSTDPRDRIYALLGFTSSLRLGADYTVKVEKLYENIVREFIHQTGSLAVMVLNRYPKTLNLPSWVPDFSLSLPPEAYNTRCPMGFYGADGNNWHNLSSFVPRCSPLDAFKDGQLSVSGFACDSILNVGPKWEFPTVGNAINIIKSYSKLLEETDKAYFSDKICCPRHREQELWRTLIWNASSTDRYPVNEEDDYGTAFSDLLHKEHYELPLDDSELAKKEVTAETHGQYRSLTATKGSKASLYYEAFVRNGLNRKLFVTKTGHLGSGPPEMRNGDLICVLFGMKTPVALRPVKESKREQGKSKGVAQEEKEKVQEEFTWIGHVYVHGIMHGEALAKMGTVMKTAGKRELDSRRFCLV